MSRTAPSGRHGQVCAPSRRRSRLRSPAAGRAAGFVLGAWLAAPCLAGDLLQCRALRERRDDLGERAMQEEITLVKQVRERICPRLSRAAEAANANALHLDAAQADTAAGAAARGGTGALDPSSAPIDYAALIDCRRRAEALLERTHAMLYRNRLRFTFFTAEGAALARQADALASQMESSGCPSGR